MSQWRYTFSPYTEKNGVRFVYGKDHWEEPIDWDADARLILDQFHQDAYGTPFNPPYPRPKRPIVHVEGDLFVEYSEPYCSFGFETKGVDLIHKIPPSGLRQHGIYGIRPNLTINGALYNGR